MKKFDTDMVLQCLTSLIGIAHGMANKEPALTAAYEYTELIMLVKHDSYSKSTEKRLLPLLKQLHRCPKTFIEALGVEYSE